uniref:ATP-dependent DNA helicase n=1 Tax=Caenorhabditis japonica TaxID=281687 RepID=A0A8R1ITU6_CAEJA
MNKNPVTGSKESGSGFLELSKAETGTIGNLFSIEPPQPPRPHPPKYATTTAQEEYWSQDEVEEESTNKYMTTKFLNFVRTSFFPPLRFRLKVGSFVILLRNLEELKRNCILRTFATGSNKRKDTFVPRINCYKDKNLSSRLKRTQFPVKLAFTISINKAQGQSFGRERSRKLKLEVSI